MCPLPLRSLHLALDGRGKTVGGRGKRMKPTQGENRGRVLVGREERHRERDREGEGGMEECKEDERDRQTD